jgi:hypothetical protein
MREGPIHLYSESRWYSRAAVEFHIEGKSFSPPRPETRDRN